MCCKSRSCTENHQARTYRACQTAPYTARLPAGVLCLFLPYSVQLMPFSLSSKGSAKLMLAKPSTYRYYLHAAQRSKVTVSTAGLALTDLLGSGHRFPTPQGRQGVIAMAVVWFSMRDGCWSDGEVVIDCTYMLPTVGRYLGRYINQICSPTYYQVGSLRIRIVHSAALLSCGESFPLPAKLEYPGSVFDGERSRLSRSLPKILLSSFPT